MKLVNLESEVKSNQLATNAQSLSEKTSSTKVPTSQNSLETKIKAITQNGSLTTLVISADEFTEYASILAKISGKYTLSVSGVQASNVSYVLSNKYVSSISVSDSIKNITSNLSVLISNLTKITSITETGQISPVALTAAQYSSALTSKFTNFTATVSSVLANNAVTILADSKVSYITITDTCANIATSLDVLQSKITKITSITQSGNVSALAISATQLTNDASVLAKISGIYTLSVSGVLASNVISVLSNTHVSSIGISDTAKNINTSLTSLISNLAKINAITETGTISSIVLTTSQYSSALTAKFSNFTATVSGVLAAKVASIATDTKVESMTVVDTSANIAASLDALQTSIAKITFISQSDSSAVLAITANQLNNDAFVLAKITGMYTLKISDSLAANVPNLVNNMHVISISIADTAVNISAYLVSLVGVSNKITAISVLDSSPIVLTESQLHSSVGTLALIQGAYTLTVTNVAAKNLIDVLSNPHVTSVSITDTAANISTYLDSIQILSNQIANITLVDNAPIAVSESQLTSDAKALLLLQPSYSLTVNSVAAGDLATIFTNTHVSSISISDTASNVATNLDKIQANLLAGKSITGITVTDNNLIHITESQLTSDVDALGLILGSYSLDVTNATAGNLGNIFNNSHVTSVSITDSTANIAANLDAIEADLIAGKPITSISANDINDISLTQSQLTSDARALALLSGSYSLAINNALAADVLKISTNSHISSIVISDTTSNINDNLDNIQNAINLGTHIKSIQVADQPNIVDFLLAPNAAVGSSDFGQYISISGISGAPVISDQTYSSGSANSVYFNGTSQLNIVDPNLNLGTSNYQISFEMKTDGPQTPYSTFMSAGGVWFANCPAYGNYLRFVDGSVDAWGKGNINDGVWHTVLVSQINGVASFYIDGNLEVSAINGVSGTNPSVNFYTAQMVLGHLQGQWAGNWDNSYRGWIDDFKIATLPVTKTLSITESQLNSDAGALALISGSYNLAVTDVQAGDINSVLTNTHVSSIAISDTASNVATNLDKIQANLLAGKSITGITITDNNPIILTESQLIKDADALALISGDYRLAVTDVPIADLLTVQNQGRLNYPSISISDSVANIVANLDLLQNNLSVITSITPTDSTTPISLTSTQVNQHYMTLQKLVGDSPLHVSGSFSQFISDGFAFGLRILRLPLPSSYAITDSAENISANLPNFLWGAVLLHLNPVITVTDPSVPIHITGVQMNWNTIALYCISGDYLVNITDVTAVQAYQWLSQSNPHVISVAISDTAEQISQWLDLFNYFDHQTHRISSIYLTDSQPISINTNQLINESNILNTINNANGNFLAITDSSDQIASNLDVLQANISKISSITQSGITTPLAITAAQLTNDADVLAKLTGNYTLKVSDVLAANVSDILSNSHVTSIAIADTAGSISVYLDSLVGVSNRITTISVLDSSPIMLTEAQLHTDIGVLGLIQGAYTLSVTNVEAKNLIGLLRNAHVASVSICDTAANISTYLDTIETFSHKVANITLVDNAPITVFESQLTTDAQALALINGNYTYTVITGNYTQTISDVLAVDAPILLNNSHVTAVAVTDTSSNISTYLDALEGVSNRITTISVLDSSPIVLTESQLTSDVDAIGLILGSYSLDVTNATAGNLGNIFSNSHVTSVSITDSTANIAANLDVIEADLIAGKSITGITITDNNPIVLTESQLTKDADALALISGNYRLEVTNVPIADLFTVQNQGQSHLSAYSISISDSVANIVSNFGTLANNYGIIKSITPTDPTTPISLKSTQLSQYSNVVPKLAGDYHLEISGNVSDFRSQAYTLWNLRHPISFTITDSAENLSTNYSSIFWSMVISQVAPTINLTDPSVPININGYQLTYQAHILYYIGGADFSNNGAYLLNVTDATIDQALPWLSSPHLASITILDTSVKISQQLDWLNHLDTQYNNVSSISVTDGQLISINVSQLINDINLLNKINLSSSFLAITDSSDQIASNLDVLQENISKISSITQSGIATPLAITATQLTNDADVLAKLTGNYTLKVSDVLAANVSDILNNTHVTSISITDTAANILANLDALELVNGKFTSITLSDNTPMTLTVAQLIADHDVIAKITNSGAITILDTAINIDTNIAYLHSLGSQITSISIAEKVPTIDWVHQFGLSSTSNSSIVWGLASSGNANGDLFVAGYSWDYANYPASNTTYLSKVDANGNTLWTENLGSSQSIGAEGSVISDIAGNVYIETMGTSGPYLEKLSTNGEMIWKTSQPNLQTNYLTAQVFNALSLDDSGYIYAIGDTYKGLSTIANKGGLDGYLAKYDPVTGAAIWETLIGSSANDQLQSVTTDVLGNVYVSGTTFGNVAAVNSGGSDGFVAKYSSNGVLIWEKQFPSALNTPWGGDRGNAQVLVDGQENVYITGNTTTSVNGQPYSGGTAIYLIKLDANGNTLWTQEFGSGWETFIQSMAFTASGNIAMTGFAYGSLNGQPYQGGYGEWLSIEYGVDGTLHWTKEVGTSSNEASMAIATNSSGKIYIGGFSEGNFYSLNPTNNNIVGYVVALGSSNLELTAQEVSSNSDVLNKVANGYTVAISDTATHVSDNLDALKTISDHISRINFSDINSLVMTAPQTFDGANANTAFNLAPNALGTPSSSNFATINNWQVGDVIQYSSFLKVIGNSGPSSTGLASINAQTGLVTFDPADQTSLQDEIAAVESAIAAAGTPGAGHFAKWDNGGDTYVLVTDNHAGSAAGAGDDLVKLVGVDSYHVQLLAGVVVAH